MATETFDINEETGDVLDGLGKVYGTATRGETFTRALAIALTMEKYADPQGNIHLLAGGGDVEVVLPQRL